MQLTQIIIIFQEENEKIQIAFKSRGGMGRDKSYFTTHRILVKNGKGIGGKRKNYQTIWYKHIQGFAIEPAGSFDGDVELHVYSSAGSSAKIDFAKGQMDVRFGRITLLALRFT
jgi:Bacterial PH domain